MGLDKNDIKALIAILQKGLIDDVEQVAVSKDAPKKTTKKKRGKVEAGDEGNKFITMGFHKLHKEDCEIDKKLAQSPRTPRREKIEFVDVVCRSCGRKEKINPVLLYDSLDRYKCNKCSTSPG